VGEVTDQVTTATIATIPKNTTPTTFGSISGFALPSVIYNNQPLLFFAMKMVMDTVKQWQFGIPMFIKGHLTIPKWSLDNLPGIRTTNTTSSCLFDVARNHRTTQMIMG